MKYITAFLISIIILWTGIFLVNNTWTLESQDNLEPKEEIMEEETRNLEANDKDVSSCYIDEKIINTISNEDTRDIVLRLGNRETGNLELVNYKEFLQSISESPYGKPFIIGVKYNDESPWDSYDEKMKKIEPLLENVISWLKNQENIRLFATMPYFSTLLCNYDDIDYLIHNLDISSIVEDMPVWIN